MRLKEELRGRLTAKQLEQLTGSFDIIGSIAKVDRPRTLPPKITFLPADFKMWAIRWVTVDLPRVPVTPTIASPEYLAKSSALM